MRLERIRDGGADLVHELTPVAVVDQQLCDGNPDFEFSDKILTATGRDGRSVRVGRQDVWRKNGNGNPDFVFSAGILTARKDGCRRRWSSRSSGCVGKNKDVDRDSIVFFYWPGAAQNGPGGGSFLPT